jgi:hypothetical protein
MRLSHSRPPSLQLSDPDQSTDSIDHFTYGAISSELSHFRVLCKPAQSVQRSPVDIFSELLNSSKSFVGQLLQFNAEMPRRGISPFPVSGPVRHTDMLSLLIGRSKYGYRTGRGLKLYSSTDDKRTAMPSASQRRKENGPRWEIPTLRVWLAPNNLLC